MKFAGEVDPMAQERNLASNAGEQVSGAKALRVALLTAGRDRPYALGLGAALAGQGIALDYIGSEEVDGPEVRNAAGIRILHFRDQREDAGIIQKVFRIARYYARLIRYAFASKCPIFHVLWNNKFEVLDRTFLMALYRLTGRRVVFTAHNVNAGQRDGTDSWLNRWSLKCQYRLAHHIFVHTESMKDELGRQFQIPAANVTVVPFGINNTTPVTSLSSSEARKKLGLNASDKVILFFGNVAPYKGLEYLVEAFAGCVAEDASLRLVIAGKPKGSEAYWQEVKARIREAKVDAAVVEKLDYIPDEEVEIYFKASDVVALPYNHIFQSGVLFLGYGFGLPVIATDVGSLREEIIEGKTGFICRPRDPADLALAIRKYFGSELFKELSSRRAEIRAYANARYSWTRVGELTEAVYERLA